MADDENQDIETDETSLDIKNDLNDEYEIEQEQERELVKDFNLIKNIPVQLTLEVGGRFITIGELLEMKAGEIIPLDKEEDEALDVKINGTLIARGEVVLVENRYGVRLLDVISPEERLKMIS